MGHATTSDLTISVTRDDSGATTVARVPAIDFAAERARIQQASRALDEQHRATFSAMVADIEEATANALTRLSNLETHLAAAYQAAQTVPLRHDTPLDVVIAVVCHEADRLYCASLGDTSQVPFPQAHPMIQSSIIDGARKIISGEITTPEQSHDAWVRYKLETGWTYGPQKSIEAKTHPNLVDFAELSVEQRTKDVLFVSIANALCGRGFTPTTIAAPAPAAPAEPAAPVPEVPATSTELL